MTTRRFRRPFSRTAGISTGPIGGRSMRRGTTTAMARFSKAPVGGGSTVTLASHQLAPAALASDWNNLYRTNVGQLSPGGLAAPATGSVMKVPVGGGATTMLASGQNLPLGIAVSGGVVYWAEFTLSAPGNIQSVPVGGGSPITLVANVTDPVRDRRGVRGGLLDGQRAHRHRRWSALSARRRRRRSLDSFPRGGVSEYSDVRAGSYAPRISTPDAPHRLESSRGRALRAPHRSPGRPSSLTSSAPRPLVPTAHERAQRSCQRESHRDASPAGLSVAHGRRRAHGV